MVPRVRVLPFLAVLLATSPALAIERQHHIGISPMLGILDVDSKSTMSVGAGGGIHYAYGLNDQFNLTASASSAVVALDQDADPNAPPDRPSQVSHASVGGSYVIDILQWVPWIGVEAGGYHLAGGTLADPLLAVGGSAGAGLDYQLSRSWAVGAAARQHLLLNRFDAYPSYTTVTARLEFMWGY